MTVDDERTDGARTSRGRLSDTDRIEAFSDGVFAIAITLLVLDLRRSGDVVDELRHDWTSYLAYVAAFLTISSNWVNHHALFTRVARADATVLVANLLVLLGASIVPWPTALIAASFRDGRHADQVAAIGLYAGTSLVVTGAWVLLTNALVRRPELLVDPADRRWVRRQVVVVRLTPVPVLIAAGVAFVAPIASLLIYVVLPLLYIGSIFREDREPPSS